MYISIIQMTGVTFRNHGVAAIKASVFYSRTSYFIIVLSILCHTGETLLLIKFLVKNSAKPQVHKEWEMFFLV